MNDDTDELETPIILEDDFIIRVRPIKTKDNKYDGEASFSVISSPNTEMPHALYKDIEFIVKCMLSTVPLMEQDEDFKEYVFNYVDNYFEYEFDTNTKPTIKGQDGNVITIDFSTDTKGRA